MENYQKQLDQIIESLDKKPSLLLHSCCGPCSSYCIEYLSKYFEVTVLFYNPNIHPREEYEKRLEAQKKLIEKMGLAKLEIGEYDDAEFFERVKNNKEDCEGGQRCQICFEMRLEKTAQLSRGYDYFCSTLTVSPHKNSRVINEIGIKAAQKYNAVWLPSDFKKREGYKRSIELAKQYDLYRQNYCGCVYSNNEKSRS